MYLIVTLKIFAVVRHQLYIQIRSLVRSHSTHTEKYVTKNEMKEILGSLDVRKIREDVFDLYSLKLENQDLVKAYYTFMID